MTATTLYGWWQVALGSGLILLCMWALARLLDRFDR